MGNLYQKNLKTGQATKFYYANGQRIAMRDTSLHRLINDHLGSIASVTPSWSGTGTTNYSYYDNGQPKEVGLPNGVVTSFDYDDADRLETLVNKDPSAVPISSFAYLYDDIGNRKQMTDVAGNTFIYSYDELYRLTGVDYPGATPDDTYEYDVNGNRTWKNSTNYLYDVADQLINAGGTTTYVYDAAGNLDLRGADDFSFDYLNRMTGAIVGGVVSSSTYNGDGLRMSHTANGQTADYAWDVNRGLPQVLMDGANKYVYGLDLISATDGSGNTTYFTTDGLGSTTDITNSAGVKTDGYNYDVFGADTHSPGTSENYWQFTGEQTDADSGLQYLRARYYDPDTGRFLSMDPITAGYPYAYAGNNPVNLSDPSGLWPGCGRWCNPCNWIDCGGALRAGESTVDAFADYFSDKGQDAFAVAVHCVNGPASCGSDVAALALSLGCTGDRKTGEDGWIYYESSAGLCNFMFWISDASCYTPGAITFCEIVPEPWLVCHEFQHFKQSRDHPFPEYWIYALGPGEEEATRLENSCNTTTSSKE